MVIIPRYISFSICICKYIDRRKEVYIFHIQIEKDIYSGTINIYTENYIAFYCSLILFFHEKCF